MSLWRHVRDHAGGSLPKRALPAHLLLARLASFRLRLASLAIPPYFTIVFLFPNPFAMHPYVLSNLMASPQGFTPPTRLPGPARRGRDDRTMSQLLADRACHPAGAPPDLEAQPQPARELYLASRPLRNEMTVIIQSSCLRRGCSLVLR